MAPMRGVAILSIALFAAQAAMLEACAGEHGGRMGGGRSGGKSWRPAAPPVNPGGGEAPAVPDGEKKGIGEAEKPDLDQKGDRGRAEGVADDKGAREAVPEPRGEASRKRIECNIEKGALSADELEKVQELAKSLAKQEEALKGPGKLSLEEFKAMQKTLDESSLCIWKEKCENPPYSYGKTVFANAAFLGRFNNEDLLRSEAKALLGEFRSGLGLLYGLAATDMAPDERKRRHAQYNDFLNRHFELR